MVEGSTPSQLAALSSPFDIPLPKWKGHNRERSEERHRREAAEQAGGEEAE